MKNIIESELDKFLESRKELIENRDCRKCVNWERCKEIFEKEIIDTYHSKKVNENHIEFIMTFCEEYKEIGVLAEI